jgi:hypothetical protein
MLIPIIFLDFIIVLGIIVFSLAVVSILLSVYQNKIGVFAWAKRLSMLTTILSLIFLLMIFIRIALLVMES